MSVRTRRLYLRDKQGADTESMVRQFNNTDFAFLVCTYDL